MTVVTDIASVLNNHLRNKPHVEYTRQATRQVQHCIRVQDNGFEKGLQCFWRDEAYTERYSGPAQVASTEVVDVRDIIFDEERITTFPENVRLQRQTYQNCDDVSSSLSLSMSVSGTQTYSLAFTKAITTNTSFSANFRFSGKFGSLGTTMGFRRSVRVGETETIRNSQTVSRSVSARVSIPPKSSGVASLLAYETEIEVPFKATVVVEGALTTNESGFGRASDLLSLDERTTTIEGVLQIKDVSDGVFKTENFPGGCPNLNEDAQPFEEKRSFQLPATALSEEQVSGFRPMSDAFGNKDVQFLDAKLHSFGTDSAKDGPEFEPIPDGVQYTILYTRSASRPDVQCGFNDLGFANIATFDVEVRQYLEYVDGHIVNSWTEEEETFTGCYVP
ncbi:MAG: hypothetical protein AB8B82_15775 [Roseovarius sp.]